MHGKHQRTVQFCQSAPLGNLFELFELLDIESIERLVFSVFRKKINQEKTKHQAIVCIMRRTCNIIYGMLKEEKE